MPRTSVTALTAFLAVAMMAGCDRSSPSGSVQGKTPTFKATDITGAGYAQALSLPDVDGRSRALAEFKGKVVVVFFGYTQCPDVCPTTLSELAEVKRSLGPDGGKLQGLFVTLDPARDTPERLKAYMASFDPSFIALRGTEEQTAATAKEFKVFYAKVPGKAEGSYTVDHLAGSFIYDTQGRLRLFSRYGSGAGALAGDIRALLGEAPSP